MEQCHRASVKFTKQLLESIESLDYERALEVAAGDGIFTFDLLGDLYTLPGDGGEATPLTTTGGVPNTSAT